MKTQLTLLPIGLVSLAASAAYVPAPPAGLINAATDPEKAFSSSTFYGEGDAHFAFDGVSSDKNRVIWTRNTEVEIGYDFGEPTKVVAYQLSQSDTKRGPKAFTLEGSNDKETWTEVDAASTSAQSDWTMPRCYTADHPGTYRYYRLLAGDNVAGNTYTELRELELFVQSEEAPVTIAPIVRNVDGNFEVSVTAGTSDLSEVSVVAYDQTKFRTVAVTATIDGGLSAGETKQAVLTGLADYTTYPLGVVADGVRLSAGVVTTGDFSFSVTQLARGRGDRDECDHSRRRLLFRQPRLGWTGDGCLVGTDS